MYSVEGENVCTIGVPSRAKQSGSLKPEAGITRIGGHAAWHNPTSAPTTDSVKCPNCGSSSSMVLVAQIYAPITFDRSLYAFVCNTRTCSLQSSGWVIVRNQKQSEKDTIAEAPNLSTSTSESATKGSEWNFLDVGSASAANTSSAASTSAWGDFSFGDEADACKLDDLEALLNVRDMTLQTSENKNVSALSSAVAADSASNGNVYKTEQCLPCSAVMDEEEYWTAADERAAWEGLLDSEYTAADGSGQDHIDKLLASYYEGEEDVEIVNLVKQQGNKGNKKADNASAEDTVQTPPTSAAPPAAKTTKAPKATKVPAADENGEGDGDDGDSEAGIDMKLSRGSRRQQVETYFQSRVSYYPTQVLRYAYVGTPLWITHPSPLELAAAVETKTVASAAKAAQAVVEAEETVFVVPNSKRDKKNAKADPPTPVKQKSDAVSIKDSKLIPCCEGCGKPRVFECQLMPALLSYVSTPQASTATKGAHSGHKTNTDTSATTVTEGQPSAADIERFRASLGEGLDFGVVAIYSCPDSCDGKRAAGFATEVAVVQAPPDII